LDGARVDAYGTVRALCGALVGEFSALIGLDNVDCPICLEYARPSRLELVRGGPVGNPTGLAATVLERARRGLCEHGFVTAREACARCLFACVNPAGTPFPGDESLAAALAVIPARRDTHNGHPAPHLACAQPAICECDCRLCIREWTLAGRPNPASGAVGATAGHAPVVTEGAAGGPAIAIRDASDGGRFGRAIRPGVRSLAEAAPLSPGARVVTEDPITRRPTDDDAIQAGDRVFCFGPRVGGRPVWPPDIQAEIAAGVHRVAMTLRAARVCSCDVCLAFAVANWRDVGPLLAPAIDGKRAAGHAAAPDRGKKKTHPEPKNFPRHAASVTPRPRGKK